MTLVLVAHGTRDPDGAAGAAELAGAVARRIPSARVALAFADVRGPSVTQVLAGARQPGPFVVVPTFLAAGHHLRVDLPGQIARSGRADVRLTAPLGPAAALVTAAMDRLVAAGWQSSDVLVLAAAGSSDPASRADVRRAALQLSRAAGQPVGVGYIATGRPSVHEAVELARRSGRRVAVASWLLSPGVLHRWLAQSGADLVSAPIGTHPLLVDHLIRRYVITLDQAATTPGSQPRRPRPLTINRTPIR
jgi:sirohydrochlorin ferrochelatase